MCFSHLTEIVVQKKPEGFMLVVQSKPRCHLVAIYSCTDASFLAAQHFFVHVVWFKCVLVCVQDGVGWLGWKLKREEKETISVTLVDPIF